MMEEAGGHYMMEEPMVPNGMQLLFPVEEHLMLVPRGFASLDIAVSGSFPDTLTHGTEISLPTRSSSPSQPRTEAPSWG